jgi:outer membrane protein OmpA-like peptidoglycan-associated protein
MNCDIFQSELETVIMTIEENGKKYDTIVKQWSKLKNIGPNVNGPQTWEGQPSLSADAKTLYFASARPGGFGKMDIYYSERSDDGIWGKAKNIGRPINTSESDKSPFIHTDSKTLYFVSESSDLRWGAGDFDIFFTKQSKNEGKWDEPQNIGYPINSEAPEESLIVSVDGRYGYFSSQRSNGLGGKDIFYFEIPEIAKPDKIILAKGQADADDPEMLKKTKISIRDSDGQKKEQDISIDSDGEFIAVLNVEEIDGEALVEIESDSGAYQSLLITKEDVNKTVIKEKEIEINAIEKGKAYTINDIVYETNSSNLLGSSKIVLDGFSEWLKSNSALNIEIQGHTDNVGSNNANMALSMDRAFSVMEYLISNGIDTSRVKFKGYGETLPKASNDTDKGRSTNRRTDFLIY